VEKILIIGLILLPFHQRVGWFDPQGPNIIAIILRADSWLVPMVLTVVFLPRNLY